VPEETERRYEKAHEYFEVCRKLWDSWEKDALIMDPEIPLFADPEKVHHIDFKGQYYSSRGPLNVTRSPQNGPVILQAGTSPKGRDFAAQYAEAVFSIQPQRTEAKKYRDDIRKRAAELGRDPNSCKVLFGAQVVIGSSEEEAEDKLAQHNNLVEPEAGMTVMSAHLNFDLSTLPPNSIMESHDHPLLQRMKTRYRDEKGQSLTVAEVAKRHGQGVGVPQFAGTPESVTDRLLEYLDYIGGDGFVLSPLYNPGSIEEFVDFVVPELQRRDRFRNTYKGTTLREHLSE